MTTLHQLTDKCLAVAGLPSDAYDLEFMYSEIEQTKILTYKTPFRYDNYKKRNWNWEVKGNWRILGKANELTDEQWKEVVHPQNFECPNIWCEDGYIDQGYGDKWKCDYCLEHEDMDWEESGKSLLKLHKLENPLILIKE